MPDPAATADATSAPDATSGAETTDTTTAATVEETGDGGKRAIDALRRELRDANRRTRELEEAERARQDAERSELEKATSRAEQAEQRIAALEHETMQREVAIAAGIADDWSRLRGDARAELEADAADFVERYGTTAQRQQQQTTEQRTDFGAGARPATPATGRAGFNEQLRRSRRR